MSRSELHFIVSFQLLLLSVVAGISRQILLSERRHEINGRWSGRVGLSVAHRKIDGSGGFVVIKMRIKQQFRFLRCVCLRIVLVA